MEEVGLQTAISKAKYLLNTYYMLEPEIVRIQEVVQNNPDFFGTVWGDDLLRSAADKLEIMAQKWNSVYKEDG